jgi:hypothetical protein
VYAYTWHIVLKRKWGRKTVSTETFHKLRGCLQCDYHRSLYLLTFASSIPWVSSSLATYNEGSITCNNETRVVQLQMTGHDTIQSGQQAESQHHKKSVASNTTDRNHSPWSQIPTYLYKHIIIIIATCFHLWRIY